jgi:putative flippase GtrA
MTVRPGEAKRTSLLGSFSRSQVAAAIATGVDFALLFLLTEAFGVWSVVAVALGALAGAITNFLLNRYWSFRAAHDYWRAQAFRYALSSAGSLVLNTAGVYAVTEGLRIHYAISVGVVSILVGVLFNFPLHRYWVFR